VSLVVSDSGPVHYLVLCEAIEVIPKLYGQLVIPSAVAQELTHPQTPAVVSRWIHTLPHWATIQAPAQIDVATHLGLGEREAISLALELKATQLLIDDRAARRVALQRGLLTAGTVAIMEQAAANGLLNLSEAIQKLLNTNFRINMDVVRETLEHDAGRRKSSGLQGTPSSPSFPNPQGG
jgi:predicted nucleic acid-binding protein